MNLLEKALSVAFLFHSGQKDKGGKPYILHPLRVMMNFKDEDAQIVAVLHDILEDTAYPVELLYKTFTTRIADAVFALTKEPDKAYNTYIDDIVSGYRLAMRVKRKDLEDNMNTLRLFTLSDKDLARLKKYHRAWNIINDALGEER